MQRRHSCKSDSQKYYILNELLAFDNDFVNQKRLLLLPERLKLHLSLLSDFYLIINFLKKIHLWITWFFKLTVQFVLMKAKIFNLLHDSVLPEQLLV